MRKLRFKALGGFLNITQLAVEISKKKKNLTKLLGDQPLSVVTVTVPA